MLLAKQSCEGVTITQAALALVYYLQTKYGLRKLRLLSHQIPS
jgi:hypothetical protein